MNASLWFFEQSACPRNFRHAIDRKFIPKCLDSRSGDLCEIRVLVTSCCDQMM
jgi:hypothetical protein